MKALFVSNDPAILDSGSGVRKRMREYADAIGTLHIVTRSQVPVTETEGNLIVHGIAASRLGAMGALRDAARKLIASEGIEVVSAQDPFEHGLAAMRAVRGTTAKLHIQVHTDFLSPWFVTSGMPFKNRVRRFLADRVLPRADGIRVVSERIRASLISRYGSRISEPAVIPIAVGTTLPDAVPLPPHPFPFAFITVGRLEPEKRIEDILEALARIRESRPDVGLVIIGEGREERRLQELTRTLGLTDRVIFSEGWRTDSWGLMRSAQAYIQSSAYEGYGRTLVEAALARIPIITTDVGVVGELFNGYEDVLAAPPADPAQLALHMVALLEDAAAREAMVRSAEQKALAHTRAFAHLPHLIAQDLARLV